MNHIIFIYCIISQFFFNLYNYLSNFSYSNCLAITGCLLTYAIPFAFNIYKEIVSNTKWTNDDIISSVIKEHNFELGIRLFRELIQIPTAIFLFIIIFLFPAHYNFVRAIFLFIFFIYSVFLPQIFEKIVKKSSSGVERYLATCADDADGLIKVFSEIWKTEDKLLEDKFRIKLDSIYSRYCALLKDLFIKKKYQELNVALSSFYKYQSKRSLYSIVAENNILGCLLSLNYEFIGIETLDSISCSTVIVTILNDIEKSVLMGDSFLVYEYFELVKDHIENIVNKEYLARFFSSFAHILFENAEKSTVKYDIWNHYFPNEWKVTIRNWEKSIIPYLFLREFLDFCQRRINSSSKGFDIGLDRISQELFPEVEPIFWSIMLTFLLSFNIPGHEMKALIEGERKFGYASRVKVYWGEEANSDDKFVADNDLELKYSIELLVFLFKDTFPFGKIDSFISELNSLKYPDDSGYAGDRKRLIKYLNEIKNFKSNGDPM